MEPGADMERRVGEAVRTMLSIKPVGTEGRPDAASEASCPAPVAFGQADEDRLEQALADAARLADAFAGGRTTPPEAIDDALEGWSRAGPERLAEDRAAAAAGAALGEALVRDTGLLWRVVEDGDGRDYAVCDAQATACIFPEVLVREQIARGNYRFCRAVHRGLKHAVTGDSAPAPRLSGLAGLVAGFVLLGYTVDGVRAIVASTRTALRQL
jgi:hypothetical protein